MFISNTVTLHEHGQNQGKLRALSDAPGAGHGDREFLSISWFTDRMDDQDLTRQVERLVKIVKN